MNCEDGEIFLPALKDFIVSEFLDGHDSDFDEFTPLLEWGIIDSISMARLLAFVRTEFGFRVDQSAVIAANVVNLATFANYLARIQSGVVVRQAHDVANKVGQAGHWQGAPLSGEPSA